MSSSGWTHWKRRHCWKTTTGPRQSKDQKRMRKTNETSLDTSCEVIQREAMSKVMTRPISQGIAAPGQEEMRKIAELLAQDDRPMLPSMQWREQGRKEAVDLAHGRVYEHHKPFLADHRAMDAFGRFGSLVAKADTSDRPLGALACPSLVAANLGTKGTLRPLQHWSHTQETGERNTFGARPGKPERGRHSSRQRSQMGSKWWDTQCKHNNCNK